MGIKVLSLFDGISCGKLAFDYAEIAVDAYHAYEIEKHCKAISKYNFPNIKQHGDVTTADFTQYKDFDWVIGGSPCFGAGTMIYTSDGYKDIKNIQVGDMVLTHKNRFRPVTHIGGKVSETVVLEAQGILPTITTLNHPYYSREQGLRYKPETRGMIKSLGNSSWVRVEDMTPKKTHIGINQLQTCEDREDITDEDLWILGRYTADGHNRMSKRTERKNSYQYQVILSIGNGKLEAFKEKVTQRHCSIYPHSQSAYRACFSSEYLCKLIKTLKIGERAIEKNIPPEILNLPINRLKIFLDGYFSGDGCKVKNGMTATTVSIKLALSLSLAILKVYGVSAKLHLPKHKPTAMICGRTINQSQQYVIQFKYKPTFATNGRIIENQMWTSFKGIKQQGQQRVYNMSVLEDESYTANNAIVHNCTHWSIAKKDRETTSDGIGFELFSHFARAIKETGCKYFLYENNHSIHKDIKEEITKSLGVELIMINSALLSAQNRKRCYWVGVRQDDGTYKTAEIEQPQDLGIVLKDILVSGEDLSSNDKSYCLTSSYNGAVVWNTLERNQRTMVAEPVVEQTQIGKDKCRTLTASYANKAQRDFLKDIETNGFMGHTGIIEPCQLGHISNKNSQANRVYAIEGKSVALQSQSGGGGAKTGLYAIPVEFDGDIPIRAKSLADGKEYTVYQVIDGFIDYKGKKCALKLPNGFYIIRKLTPVEAERLQTIPDNFSLYGDYNGEIKKVADTNRYKGIGNGWSAKVITHIIKQTLKLED